MMNETQHSQSAIDYLRSILSSNIYDLAQVTPLQKMEKLSERLGNSIFIKREDRQPVHSFKLRGAFAMISNLSKAQKRLESLRLQQATTHKGWHFLPNI